MKRNSLNIKPYLGAIGSGLIIGFIVMLLVFAAKVVTLGDQGVFHGELYFLGLPIGYLDYDKHGYSVTQRSLMELSVPLLFALAGAVALYVSRIVRKPQVKAVHRGN